MALNDDNPKTNARQACFFSQSSPHEISDKFSAEFSGPIIHYLKVNDKNVETLQCDWECNLISPGWIYFINLKGQMAKSKWKVSIKNVCRDVKVVNFGKKGKDQSRPLHAYETYRSFHTEIKELSSTDAESDSFGNKKQRFQNEELAVVGEII